MAPSNGYQEQFLFMLSMVSHISDEQERRPVSRSVSMDADDVCRLVAGRHIGS